MQDAERIRPTLDPLEESNITDQVLRKVLKRKGKAIQSLDPLSEAVHIRFGHGLGDCVNFACVLALHAQRGHRFELDADADKAFLFSAVDSVVLSNAEGAANVPWHDALRSGIQHGNDYLSANKIAINISAPPLPDLGRVEDLWDELCNLKLDIRPHIPAEAVNTIKKYISELPRPLVLVHPMGNTYKETKDMPAHVALDLYRRLLDNMEGSLILLDWDNRVPRLANYRVRHLTDDFHRFNLAEMFALLAEADLIVGVDSGPLHGARLTDTPAVGYFPNDWQHPARFCLPRDNQVNVVPSRTDNANRRLRMKFNLVECPQAQITSEFLAETCLRVLAGPRYLSEDRIGADVQLQQFVLDWERAGSSHLSEYPDRHHGFDHLLREMSRRFVSPLVLETGCIRSPEDWSAGYGTYLLGAYLHNSGGKLISVDLDPENCEFARSTMSEIPCVEVVCDDSLKFLKNFETPIDVLYLDSLDTDQPLADEHALSEIQAALPNLHSRSLVLFDDTVYSAKRFTGKGARAVPWLLAQGWKILHSGYQTLCAPIEN